MDERVKVKTIDQARALPELKGSWFDHRLCGSGICGDEIILFVDHDGRSMQVVHTEEGRPAKMEFRL